MNVITLVECPYCRKNFIPEDGDVVCTDCEGIMSLDIAIVETLDGLARILTIEDKELKKREQQLTELLRQARNLENKLKGDEKNDKEPYPGSDD